MRVLIVGASGLIGSHLMGAAGVRCIEGVGTYRHHPKDGLIRLDLADQPATERLLDSVRPDWVVHAAGWTWVDGCEKDPARAVDENCTQPVRLARACRDRGIRFGYLSTTYIFDGESGPYSEDAIPRPINEYGRSKWSAECRLQEVLDGRALIFRTICVWGFEEQQKKLCISGDKGVKEGSDHAPSCRPTRQPDLGWRCCRLGDSTHQIERIWRVESSELLFQCIARRMVSRHSGCAGRHGTNAYWTEFRI